MKMILHFLSWNMISVLTCFCNSGGLKSIISFLKEQEITIGEHSSFFLHPAIARLLSHQAPGASFYICPAEMKKEWLAFYWNGGSKIFMCLVPQSCLTLCDPMNCSLLDTSVPGDSPGRNTGMDCHALLKIFMAGVIRDFLLPSDLE